ncbi:zinc finger and BTB domain-containing protein 49-like [Anopheles aquasalis]|uniref:zinc finger and BTB domain-containing protein 49-like n=1 Tax=Anopheles aquasalis TaxID=42839 RepID=UPI00215B3765|nr:zinc finger and BTB domain-containing protein 49-like [Anopheles aquasalis]
MLTKYCRICLTSIGVVHQLDEVVHHSLTLYAILCKMYPEAFTDNNDAQWPTRVCGICKQAVLDAYGLYIVCKATFKVLKVQLQDSSIKSNPLRPEFIFPDQNLTAMHNSEKDFKEAFVIVGNEEDNLNFPLSREERSTRSRIDKIIEEKHVNTHESECLFDELQERNNAVESVSELQNVETIKMNSEDTTSHGNKIVELSIEMDYVTPNNTISIEEEYLEDFEESIEHVEDVKDILYTTAIQETEHNHVENAIVESLETLPKESDTIRNVVCLKEEFEESEDEEAFADFYPTEVFSCKSCRDVFLEKESYEEHIKNHSKGHHSFCKICSEGFKSEATLNEHKCKHESSTLCWICGKIMNTASKLRTHIQSHIPDCTWDCQLCPLRFPTKGALKCHVITHKKDKLYCCDVCGANLSTKRNLAEHQWAQHRAKKEDRYTISCGICSQRFASTYVLKRHMNTHTGLRPYKCVYCNRVYGNGADLIEHVAKHHVGNDNIYMCHLCDADFPKIRELKAHYEVHFRKGEKFYNEILTEFGKFRFTTMDLLKMRHQKEMVALSNIVSPNVI